MDPMQRINNGEEFFLTVHHVYLIMAIMFIQTNDQYNHLSDAPKRYTRESKESSQTQTYFILCLPKPVQVTIQATKLTS